MSFVSVDFDFYSDILIFFGGFTAAKIRRRIQLAEFFSADIRRTKIRRLIQIFDGGLEVYNRQTDDKRTDDNIANVNVHNVSLKINVLYITI